MNFSGFMQFVSAPSRWWRRPRKMQITLWPTWLAQALCPHQQKAFYSEDKAIWRCDDCWKFNFPQGTKAKTK